MSNNKNRNKSVLEPTVKMLHLTEEQKVKAAVRCISGEPAELVAAELGVTEEVIQGWVDKVSDLVENKEEQPDTDLEHKMAKATGECNLLQKKIAAMRRQVEIREIEMRMLRECPPFMIGGGRRPH